MTIYIYLYLGCSILRKDVDRHLNTECNEQLLDCSNNECKLQIARKNLDNHVNNECKSRIVSCPFSKFGCNVKNIKANELQKHEQEYKLDHLSNQFNHITNELNDKIQSQNDKISVLEQQNNNLNDEIITLQQKDADSKRQINQLSNKTFQVNIPLFIFFPRIIY